MDAVAYHKLEAALTSAKVPRSLWPRYFEKEEHRLLRRRCRDEEEYRRIMQRRLSEREHGERARRERWALFLIILLWLLQQQQQQRQSAREFVQQSWRALLTTEHGRNDPESAQVALAGITLACFPEKETADALQHGATSMDGRATCPLREGIKELERAMEEERRGGEQIKPIDKPGTPTSPTSPTAEAISGDEERERRKNLADPGW